jgi:hypothetical protein
VKVSIRGTVVPIDCHSSFVNNAIGDGHTA